MSTARVRQLLPRSSTRRLVSAASPLLLQVDDRHVGPLGGERDRHGAADAAVAAGDDGDAIGQPIRHVPRSVLRPRDHLVFAAGLDVLLLRGG